MACAAACLGFAFASHAPAQAASQSQQSRCARIALAAPFQQRLVEKRRLTVRVRRCGRERVLRLRAETKAAGSRPVKIASARASLPRWQGRVQLHLTRRGRRALRGCEPQAIKVHAAYLQPRAGTAQAKSALRLRGRCVTQKPNVLLIITDDQRLDGSAAVMPNTWREFGQFGTEYTNAFVTTPLCCPSRASIYSGKYPHNHGVRRNGGLEFDPAESWQRYLHDAGYFMGLFGKYFFSITPRGAPYFNRAADISGEDPQDGPKIDEDATSFLREAEARDRQPWALVVATNQPHYPWNGRPSVAQGLPPYSPFPSFGEQDLSDKHPAVADEAARFDARGPSWPPEVRNGQRWELQQVDEMVGDVMSQLDRLDERQRTLAIFTSDNGYMWGEHGVYHKLWPYLESVRVPLFASWPGHVAEGALDDRLVANIDIAPTIMEAAGVTPRYPVDGRSLFDGYDRPWLLLESAIKQDVRVPDWTGMVSDSREYIQWENGFVEDYDLAADPYELDASNVSDPAVQAMLAQAGTCAGSDCP